MMSRTHIAVGVASALAIAQTGSVESCVAAVVGGSVGGIIADCDITPSKAHKDALIGRIVVVVLAAAAMAADYWHGTGVCDFIVANFGIRPIAGVALFALLTFVGGRTDHRSFTHSLLAMGAFCVAVHLACEPLLPYFVLGYASHLVLDVTNKQGVRLFWPLHVNVSLGLCRAKGVANTVAMVLGSVLAVFMLVYRLGVFELVK